MPKEEKFEVFSMLQTMWKLIFLKPNMSTKDYIIFYLGYSFMVFNILSNIVSLFQEETMTARMESLSCMFYLFETTLLFGAFIIRHKEHFELVYRVKLFYELNKSDEEDKAIIESCQKVGDKYVRVFKFMPTSTAFLVAMGPFLHYFVKLMIYKEAKLVLPYKTKYPLFFGDTINFYITVLFMMIQTLYLIPMIIVMLSTPIYFFMATVAHFKITQKRFRNLSTCKTEDLDKLIKIAAKSHQETLDFLDNVKRIGSKQYFIKCMMSSLSISLNLLLLATPGTDSTRKLVYSEVVFALVILVYLLCSFGQKIIDEINNLTEEMYNVNWYVFPIHIRRTLIICLMKSQNTKPVTGWKFTEVSLVSFQNVLTASYSYFTFLSTVT